MSVSPALQQAAEAWIAGDPDRADASTLDQLLAAAATDPAAEAELADRFVDRLRFGTAGLRGVEAPGPNRMNRAMVRTASAALAAWLHQHVPTADGDGVVIGCDARHGSSAFAAEAARVLVGAGIRVHLLEEQRPTPMLAFAVRHLGAAAGVMVTASHNPAPDNGYKLYLGDGAQIVPPVDREIEALMDQVGPLAEVLIGDLGGPLVVRHGPEVAEAFLAAIVDESPAPGPSSAPVGRVPLRVVYTPMHGVALGLFEVAMARAGYPEPIVVSAQAQPDPDFPTVAFPNPEEPGALDLALAEARHADADLVIANDPDGDRLAIAVPDPTAEGGWLRLTGDQVGGLLGSYVLERTAGDPSPRDRLVAASIVSSSLLGRIAAAAGVHHTETLTGFKWIVRAPDAQPGSRFVFGYEEALGYSIGTVVRDKDGLGAALGFLAMASAAAAHGRSVHDLWDDLERRHGVHLTAQASIRSAAPADTTRRLRAEPPAAIGGRPVVEAVDLAVAGAGGMGLPAADVLLYRLDGARLIVRPSGTEPKLKVYFEVVRPVRADGEGDGSLAGARAAAGAELADLQDAMSGLLGE